MFKLVNEKSFLIIKNFINSYEYKVATNSVLDGNTKGKVFVDNEGVKTYSGKFASFVAESCSVSHE